MEQLLSEWKFILAAIVIVEYPFILSYQIIGSFWLPADGHT